MIKVDGNEREAYIESGRLSTICFVKSIAKNIQALNAHNCNDNAKFKT